MTIPASQCKPAPHVLLERAAELGERPRFYVEHDGAMLVTTWSQFAAKVRQLALVLAEEGVGRGSCVAIFADNSVDWAAAALAIQAAGGIMVPIYASSTAEQASYILNHCSAPVVFVDSHERKVGDVRCRRLLLGDEKLYSRGEAIHHANPGRLSEMLAAVEMTDVGLMLYTSGTSGAPKGVPLTHANVAANGADWLECNAALLADDDVDLLWLPMSHVFGLGELCQGNLLGWTSYLSSPKEVLRQLPSVAPTVFFSVPAYWEKIAMRAGDGATEDRVRRLREMTGGRVRFALSGGAGLGREVKELFEAAGTVIIEGYGLTECSPTLTLNRPDDYDLGSVGKPLPSVELRLGDDGEILARGPNVFSGYFKDPEATRAAFTDDGWFRTGDLGRFDDAGFLYIIGRKKEILVTAGGKNIPPANIEMRFADDPLIEHLVVYGDGKKYLVAGIWINRNVAPSGIEQQIAQRIESVNANLASCETIKRWTIIDEPLSVENGLLTASLKLRRKHVYDAFRARFEALYA